jgi:hypothetical protein
VGGGILIYTQHAQTVVTMEQEIQAMAIQQATRKTEKKKTTTTIQRRTIIANKQGGITDVFKPSAANLGAFVLKLVLTSRN